jgi:aryl-alcohol dehydrogenase-like predicted oxidoreductase
MKFNEFGKTGLRVSEIGFGGSRIGGVFAEGRSTKDALHLLQAAMDSGVTFYDTADMYAQGESESLMGTAFRGRRKQVVIATKGGYCLPARRRLVKRIKPLVRPIVQALGLKRARLPSGMSGALTQNFSPSYLTQALEASLKRLQTDHIDLYQLHSPPVEFMHSGAFGEALETLERLRTQGKIRCYGIATEEPADAPACLAMPGISSIQIGFGLLDLESLSQGTLATAHAQGLGIIARGCFAGGLLNDSRAPELLMEQTPKWQRILALRSLCEDMKRPLLEAALQFCLGTPAVAVTLLGMRVESHLRESLRHLQAPPLTDEQYRAFSAVHDAKEQIMERDHQ